MNHTVDADDATVYHFDGFTDPGETAPGIGRKYLEAATKEFYHSDVTIIWEKKVGDTVTAHQKYWYGEPPLVLCASIKKSADEDAIEK